MARHMQAEKLRAKAVRGEVTRSGQQLARYLYYLGRIRAVRLEYSEAKDCLQQAARKVGLVTASTPLQVCDVGMQSGRRALVSCPIKRAGAALAELQARSDCVLQQSHFGPVVLPGRLDHGVYESGSLAAS